MGLYELFINGQRIGEQVLAPAPTDYRKTILYNTYDVTPQLQKENAIGVILGNGRFYTMRQNYKPYKIPTFGYPKLRLNLIVEYTDGSRQTIASDISWKLTTEGPIRNNNEYCGSFHVFGQCKLFAEVAGGKAAPLCFAVTGGGAVQADPLPLPVCFIQ